MVVIGLKCNTNELMNPAESTTEANASANTPISAAGDNNSLGACCAYQQAPPPPLPSSGNVPGVDL